MSGDDFRFFKPDPRTALEELLDAAERLAETLTDTSRASAWPGHMLVADGLEKLVAERPQLKRLLARLPERERQQWCFALLAIFQAVAQIYGDGVTPGHANVAFDAQQAALMRAAKRRKPKHPTVQDIAFEKTVAEVTERDEEPTAARVNAALPADRKIPYSTLTRMLRRHKKGQTRKRLLD